VTHDGNPFFVGVSSPCFIALFCILLYLLVQIQFGRDKSSGREKMYTNFNKKGNKDIDRLLRKMLRNQHEIKQRKYKGRQIHFKTPTI